MVSPERARELALALPGSIAADHHGRPSFRRGQRIFATVPGPAHLNLMPGPREISSMVATHADTCEVVWWGRRPAAVRVDLSSISEELLSSLLRRAWSAKATGGSGGRAPTWPGLAAIAGQSRPVCPSIPAPTVTLVPGSMTRKLPVARLSE